MNPLGILEAVSIESTVIWSNYAYHIRSITYGAVKSFQGNTTNSIKEAPCQRESHDLMYQRPAVSSAIFYYVFMVFTGPSSLIYHLLERQIVERITTSEP